MNDITNDPTERGAGPIDNAAPRARLGHRSHGWTAAGGLLAAGAIAGGVLASTGGASAATPTATATTTAAATSGSSGGSAAAGPGDRSSTPVRSDESSVGSSISSTLQSRALAAVPGGTIYRIETDAGDATYEAHMTKADGTLVTVKFDTNLNVTAVEDGMGLGDPALAGGPGGQGAPGTAGAAGNQGAPDASSSA
jgi:hypothetical protein